MIQFLYPGNKLFAFLLFGGRDSRKERQRASIVILLKNLNCSYRLNGPPNPKRAPPFRHPDNYVGSNAIIKLALHQFGNCLTGFDALLHFSLHRLQELFNRVNEFIAEIQISIPLGSLYKVEVLTISGLVQIKRSLYDTI